ncbi:hypothetical protein V8F33_013703 [Rhypophila sp. PSN 637]
MKRATDDYTRRISDAIENYVQSLPRGWLEPASRRGEFDIKYGRASTKVIGKALILWDADIFRGIYWEALYYTYRGRRLSCLGALGHRTLSIPVGGELPGPEHDKYLIRDADSEDGHFRRLTWIPELSIIDPPSSGESIRSFMHEDKPWARQTYPRSLVSALIGLPGSGKISLKLAMFLAAQTLPECPPEGERSSTFIQAFIDRLPTSGQEVWAWSTGGLKNHYTFLESATHSRPTVTFQIRCLVAKPHNQREIPSLGMLDLPLIRQTTALAFEGVSDCYLQEVRCAFSLQLGLSNPSFFRLVVLTDDYSLIEWTPGVHEASRFEQESGPDMEPHTSLEPVLYLLGCVARIVMGAKVQWDATLLVLDQMVDVQISDATDKDWVSKNMFDDGFELSAKYFTLLQTLRIFHDWIEEMSMTVDDETWGEEFSNLKPYINQVLEEKNRTVEKLLYKIARKTSEVESLRDGIFNATQLREATRATTMSSYIFIFTITTIFYLPLGFSLYGMHLFDKEDPSENQTSFYITMVLVALITYAVATGAAMLAPENRRLRVLEVVAQKTTWQKLPTWSKAKETVLPRRRTTKSTQDPESAPRSSMGGPDS